MRVIGLTGSIGMGKSTTAGMFRARGIATHDADQAVHKLYAGAAVADIETAFPGVAAEGRVDRARLAARVIGDPEALARLEAIVHPLVRQSEVDFLDMCRARGHRLALIDVPLLLEKGEADRTDVVVVVTADPSSQRQRVLARPGMTEQKLRALLMRQLPDAEKRKRAHFLVDTTDGRAAAARQVGAVLCALAYTG